MSSSSTTLPTPSTSSSPQPPTVAETPSSTAASQASLVAADNNNNLANSGEIVENIAAAVGNSEASMRLHMARDSTPLSDEPFHRDSRAQAAFMRKCAVFAGLMGTCSASAILSWRRYGKGFVARSALVQANNNDNSSSSSFLQRYLITPLLVPAALSVSFVIFRGTLFEREFRSRERAREEWELQNFHQGEIDEMVRIYIARGISPADAEKLVEITSKDDKFFVDLMMTDELGFSPVEPPTTKETLKAGFFGACSYLAAAMLPLLAADRFDLSSGNSNENDNSQLSFVPEGALAVTSLVYSLFQARMLLRSYTVQSDTTGSVVCNCGWIAATYFMTRWSCTALWS